MQLEPGTRPGNREVASALGVGGMGEVYRAKDTKLGREVAIKLLLEEVSANAERLARFEQEGEKQFLVMELVEGETLADRIKRSAIPVDEAADPDLGEQCLCRICAGTGRCSVVRWPE